MDKRLTVWIVIGMILGAVVGYIIFATYDAATIKEIVR